MITYFVYLVKILVLANIHFRYVLLFSLRILTRYIIILTRSNQKDGASMNRIKLLRTQKGITQEELGRILNVQKAAISKYELNIATPSPESLKIMADYFGVTIDYLLGRNDHQTDSSKKKLPADLKKIFEEQVIMFDGEIISDDDKEIVKNMLETLYDIAKKKNKKKIKK